MNLQPSPDEPDAQAAKAVGPDYRLGSSSDAGQARSTDLTTTAYEMIEERFVSLQLPPGSFARTQDIQACVGLGRTPVHQALRRLAAETLIEVRPRNGLRIAPIDLTRERHLAVLRRDMIRFVTEAAMRNMTTNERARIAYLRRQLVGGADQMTVDRFNEIDKSFDLLLIQTSRERFLERSLRPLHALARRTGYLHIEKVSGERGIRQSVALHLAIMDAVLSGNARKARSSCDDLVESGVAIIDDLAAKVDPHLFDVGFAPLKRADAKRQHELPPASDA